MLHSDVNQAPYFFWGRGGLVSIIRILIISYSPTIFMKFWTLVADTITKRFSPVEAKILPCERGKSKYFNYLSLPCVFYKMWNIVSWYHCKAIKLGWNQNFRTGPLFFKVSMISKLSLLLFTYGFSIVSNMVSWFNLFFLLNGMKSDRPQLWLSKDYIVNAYCEATRLFF